MSEIEINSPSEIPLIRKLLEGLRAPSEEQLKVIGRLVGLADVSQNLRKSLRSLTQHLPSLEKPTPLIPRWVYVDVYHTGPFLDTTPKYFTLGVWKCRVHDWPSVIRNACEILAIEHPEEFPVIAKLARGRSRYYFDESPARLTRSEYIPRTSLYVEKNLASNNSYSLVHELARACGYKGVEVSIKEHLAAG